MKRKAYTLIELLVTMAILCILAALVAGGVGGCSKSNGNRVGTITKFSSKGIWHKSWEGELVMGGARTSNNSDGVATVVANVWSFSVKDEAVARKIDKLQETGHRAKLVYVQTLAHNPIVRDTSYIVTDAIDLEATAEKK